MFSRACAASAVVAPPHLRRRHRRRHDRQLADAGSDVTAGVLNALDTDEETGRELGLQMAVEAPLSTVGEEAHAENLELLRAADLVVLSAVPGQRRHPQCGGRARGAAAGIPVWPDEGVRVNDFVGVVDELADAGAQFFAGEEEAAGGRSRRAARPASGRAESIR